MSKVDKIPLITSLAVAGVMVVGMVAFFLNPKESFSENENRYLAKVPEYSFESLKDGTFIDSVETYVNEHFPLRDFFMNAKTTFEKICGRTEVNNILVADDGYYIEKYEEPENTEMVIDRFNNFASKVENADVKLMLVPTAITVYKDKVPSYYKENVKQIDTMNLIYSELDFDYVDVSKALMDHKEDYQLFYRYDHHWTTYGAYVAYEKYCEAMGFDYTSIEDANFKVVSEDFKGTVYSKVNDYSVSGDEIVIEDTDKQNIQVIYDDGTITDTMYNEKYLKEKDQYSYFLNNINAKMEIINENAATDKELVVVKDSYANCMVPLLANQYKKIYVYDTRYYKKPISREINANENITDVIILYNLNTMDSDLGIKGIY